MDKSSFAEDGKHFYFKSFSTHDAFVW